MIPYNYVSLPHHCMNHNIWALGWTMETGWPTHSSRGRRVAAKHWTWYMNSYSLSVHSAGCLCLNWNPLVSAPRTLLIGLARSMRDQPGQLMMQQIDTRQQWSWVTVNCLFHRGGQESHMLWLLSHKTEDGHLTSDNKPDLAKHVRAVESVMVAFSGRPQGTRVQSMEICRLFNELRYKFKNCKV